MTVGINPAWTHLLHLVNPLITHHYLLTTDSQAENRVCGHVTVHKDNTYSEHVHCSFKKILTAKVNEQ